VIIDPRFRAKSDAFKPYNIYLAYTMFNNVAKTSKWTKGMKGSTLNNKDYDHP